VSPSTASSFLCIIVSPPHRPYIKNSWLLCRKKKEKQLRKKEKTINVGWLLLGKRNNNQQLTCAVEQNKKMKQ